MPKSTAYAGVETGYPDLGDVPSNNELMVTVDGVDYNVTFDQVLEIAARRGLDPEVAAVLAAELDPYIAGEGGNSFSLLDEDDFASDSATSAPSQQSTKAYIATQVASVAVANDSITNAKLNNMAADTIKGRATASTGDPEDLTAAQVRTILNVADGATNDQTGPEIVTLLEALTTTARLNYTAVDELDSSGAGVLATTALIDANNLSASKLLATTSGGTAVEGLTFEPDEATPGTATQASGAITLNYTSTPALTTTTSASITAITITTDSIPLYGRAVWIVTFGGTHTIAVGTGNYAPGGTTISGTSGQKIHIVIYRAGSSEFHFLPSASLAVA